MDTSENQMCPDCGKPDTVNHVCWGHSENGDFAVVKNIPEKEEEEKPKKVRLKKPLPEDPNRKKPGPVPVLREEEKSAQQIYNEKNRHKIRTKQKLLMRKRRKQAKAKKLAEEKAK